MVRFTFWVPATGWAAGGYENCHYAKDAREAQEIVAAWNREAPRPAGPVVITDITEVTREEFIDDHVGVL